MQYTLQTYLGAPKDATKYEFAITLLGRYEELQFTTPCKCKYWQSEDRKMLVLMAIAIALGCQGNSPVLALKLHLLVDGLQVIERHVMRYKSN